MSNDSYILRTQAILLALFCHYLGYTVILLIEALRPSKHVTYSPGIRIFFLFQAIGSAFSGSRISHHTNPHERYRENPLASTNDISGTVVWGDRNTGFKEKECEYTTLVKVHYLRNTLFFYVGCLCAIIAGSYMYCIAIIFGVIAEKLIEIYAVYHNKTWLAYIGHALGCLVNYTNIISAIIYSL